MLSKKTRTVLVISCLASILFVCKNMTVTNSPQYINTYKNTSIAEMPSDVQVQDNYEAVPTDNIDDIKYYNSNEKKLITIIFNKLKKYEENNYQDIGDEISYNEKGSYYFEYSECNEDELYNVDYYFSFLCYYIIGNENDFLSIWYNDETDINHYYITINPQKLKNYNEKRSYYNEKASKITNNLICNTEQETVVAIAKYISDNTTYTLCSGSLENAFDGKTKCNGYSYLFKFLCENVGISCDYISGLVDITNGNSNHAWNKINYSDGTVEYFDITWYDTDSEQPYNKQYINSKTSLHYIQTINGGKYF